MSYISRYSTEGELLHQVPIPLMNTDDHDLLAVKIGDEELLAMSSSARQEIRLYNFVTGQFVMGYNTNNKKSEHAPKHLCQGGKDELITLNFVRGAIVVFDASNVPFGLKQVIKSTTIAAARRMCYVHTTEYGGLVITCSGGPCSDGEVRAISLESERLVWSIAGNLGGRNINPRGLCSDQRGLIFVGDGRNGRVLVVNGCKGKLLQVLQPTELENCNVKDVNYCTFTGKLIVRHSNTNISSFTVTYFK